MLLCRICACTAEHGDARKLMGVRPPAVGARGALVSHHLSTRTFLLVSSSQLLQAALEHVSSHVALPLPRSTEHADWRSLQAAGLSCGGGSSSGAPQAQAQARG